MMVIKFSEETTQLTFTYSKLTIETLFLILTLNKEMLDGNAVE